MAYTIKQTKGTKTVNQRAVTELRNLIALRALPSFGLTALSNKRPAFPRYFNAQAELIQIEHAIASRRRGVKGGLLEKFKDVARHVGIAFDLADALAGPVGGAGSGQTATTATAGWTAYTGATEYDVLLYNAANTTLVQTLATNGTTSRAITGLTASTTYTVRVRALWDNRRQFTNFSTFTFTTTA